MGCSACGTRRLATTDAAEPSAKLLVKVILRADAGVETGTGHVMRCLTIAEELRARGHDAVLVGALDRVEWLSRRVAETGIGYSVAEAGVLRAETIDASADVVIVDSYSIAAEDIGRLNERLPVVAIIDGDDRGIRASAYLDSNLEVSPYPARVAERVWGGSRFALVRGELRRLRRPNDRVLPASPTVLCVMGGSDPRGAMPRVAASLRELPAHIELTFVAAPPWEDEVRASVASRANATVVPPTTSLGALLERADIVVSATGTTAWDLCTVGIPAVFVAIVDNQTSGLRAIVDAGLALGVDASEDLGAVDAVGDHVLRLIVDEALRENCTTRCRELFDGRGVERVVDALERMSR